MRASQMGNSDWQQVLNRPALLNRIHVPLPECQSAPPVRKEAYPNKGTKVTLRVKAFFAIKDLLKKAQKNRNQLEETKDQVHIISERG